MLVRPVYALEDFSCNIVLLCAILLAGELSHVAKEWYHRYLAIPIAGSMCAVSVLFPVFIFTIYPSIHQYLWHFPFLLETYHGDLPHFFGRPYSESQRSFGPVFISCFRILWVIRHRFAPDIQPF